MKTIPEVIPAGWQIVPCGRHQMLRTQTKSGLTVTFSIETYAQEGPITGEDRAMYAGPGRYRRVVLSRRNMYPTWDEMRDFIYSCGLFDHSGDVVMLLPPPSEYLNLHPNAFHFFQKEPEPAR